MSYSRLIKKITFKKLSRFVYEKIFFVNLIKNYFISVFKKYKILRIKTQNCSLNLFNQQPLFAFISALRVKSSLQLKITEIGYMLSLQEVKNIPFFVYDGSGQDWSKEIKKKLLQIAGDSLIYESRADLSMPQRYLYGLEKGEFDYFEMLFNDQPAIGITKEFIDASCKLLKTHEGLVDIVIIDFIPKYSIDNKNKVINYKMSDMVCLNQGLGKLIQKVQIGNYSFGIYRRDKYGFIFNNIIASRKDYCKRLQWYINHISQISPQNIEISAEKMIKRGPVYHYVAISYDAFMLDIDCEGSEISVRSNNDRANNAELFQAIADNYEIKKEINE
jgi:hypothetical protein